MWDGCGGCASHPRSGSGSAFTSRPALGQLSRVDGSVAGSTMQVEGASEALHVVPNVDRRLHAGDPAGERSGGGPWLTTQRSWSYFPGAAGGFKMWKKRGSRGSGRGSSSFPVWGDPLARTHACTEMHSPAPPRPHARTAANLRARRSTVAPHPVGMRSHPAPYTDAACMQTRTREHTHWGPTYSPRTRTHTQIRV